MPLAGQKNKAKHDFWLLERMEEGCSKVFSPVRPPPPTYVTLYQAMPEFCPFEGGFQVQKLHPELRPLVLVLLLVRAQHGRRRGLHVGIQLLPVGRRRRLVVAGVEPGEAALPGQDVQREGRP